EKGTAAASVRTHTSLQQRAQLHQSVAKPSERIGGSYCRKYAIWLRHDLLFKQWRLRKSRITRAKIQQRPPRFRRRNERSPRRSHLSCLHRAPSRASSDPEGPLPFQCGKMRTANAPCASRVGSPPDRWLCTSTNAWMVGTAAELAPVRAQPGPGSTGKRHPQQQQEQQQQQQRSR
ncbi:unnamed protein product, partial [Laminaria digitata]